jgi:hypothetical protein
MHQVISSAFFLLALAKRKTRDALNQGNTKMSTMRSVRLSAALALLMVLAASTACKRPATASHPVVVAAAADLSLAFGTWAARSKSRQGQK